jgi:hypothetical protein
MFSRWIFMGAVVLSSPVHRMAWSQTMPADDFRPYACIPAAAAIVLAYFDKPINYNDIYDQMDVQPDGFTSVDNLTDVCERQDLKCAAFTGLSPESLNRYLKQGYVVVVIGGQAGKEHSVCLFDSPKGILATDLRSPLHDANIATLNHVLQDDSHRVLCVVIGRAQVVPPGFLVRNWMLVLAAAIAVPLLIFMFRKGLAK